MHLVFQCKHINAEKNKVFLLDSFSIIDLHVGHCYAVHLSKLAGKHILIQPSYSELIGLLVYIKIPYNFHTNSEIQQYKNKTTKLLRDKIRNHKAYCYTQQQMKYI